MFDESELDEGTPLQPGSDEANALSKQHKTDCFLSVIINNYNYGRFVGECIESAQAAIDDQCEIIVVDDGSTDNSLEVIRSYDGVKLVSKKNGGQCSALNAGFAEASGDYVLFLDADDVLVPNALDVIRRTMPGKHMMWYAIEILHQELGVISFYPSSRVKPVPNVWSDMASKGAAWGHPMSANVFSSELLREIFPLPEKEWRVSADMVLMCFGAHYVHYDGCNEVINQYRQHGDNEYFGHVLSSMAQHIHEDASIQKFSTNFRNFYLGNVAALLEITDPNTYAAVLSHWVRIGEMVLGSGLLMKEHSKEIEECSTRLIASQPPLFWVEAARSLTRLDVNPAHLEAFHVAPYSHVVSTEAVTADVPAMVFNKDIEPKDASGFIVGGHPSWHSQQQKEMYGLSQAAYFRAKMKPLAGVLIMSMQFGDMSLAGGVRVFSTDGRSSEVVKVGDEWLCEIPCDWVVDGELGFYFVFERVTIPMVERWSASDPCTCGAYLSKLRFEVPPSNYFYNPLHLNDTQPASRYLSRLKITPSEQVLEDGAVTLQQEATVIGASLPFSTNDVEWIELLVSNTSDKPMALNVWIGDEKPVKEVLLPNERRTIAIVTDFWIFSHDLPEISIACLAEPELPGDILLHSVTLREGPFDQIALPRSGAVRFSPQSRYNSFLSESWETCRLGIRPAAAKGAALKLQSQTNASSDIVMAFKAENENGKHVSLGQIWLNANGQIVCLPLNFHNEVTIQSDEHGCLNLQGWWVEDIPFDAHLDSVRVLS